MTIIFILHFCPFYQKLALAKEKITQLQCNANCMVVQGQTAGIDFFFRLHNADRRNSSDNTRSFPTFGRKSNVNNPMVVTQVKPFSNVCSGQWIKHEIFPPNFFLILCFISQNINVLPSSRFKLFMEDISNTTIVTKYLGCFMLSTSLQNQFHTLLLPFSTCQKKTCFQIPYCNNGIF